MALQCKRKVLSIPHTSYTLTYLQSSNITHLLRASCYASRLHSQWLHPTNEAFSASLSHPVMSCPFHVPVVPSSPPRSLGVTHLAPIACYAPLAFTSQPLHSANNGVLHSRDFLRASRRPHPVFLSLHFPVALVAPSHLVGHLETTIHCETNQKRTC